MNKLNNKDRGFTIIEVVLVLAIAALIMLMVFIAWPALQRSQRDTARKNDAQTVASALGSYKSNNNGALPAASGTGATSFSTFMKNYVQNLSNYDPSAVTPTTSDPGSAVTVDKMYVVLGYGCDGNAVSTTVNSRAAAVLVKLESGGGQQLFCVQG